MLARIEMPFPSVTIALLTLDHGCVQTDTHVAADQTVSSLVAFLAAAKAVGSVQRSLWQKEVVFAAFQGER